MDVYNATLISDFTLNNLAGYLDNVPIFPRTKSTLAPFGQVMQVLMDHQHDCWLANPDIAIIWTRPEAVIRTFNKTLQFESVPLDDLLKQVDEYCALLKNLPEHPKWIFVPTWQLPGHSPGLGSFDLQSKNGITYALMHMNLRLVQNLSDVPNCIVLNAQKWFDKARTEVYNPKLWYLGKIPFSNDIFKEAAREIKAALRGLSGRGKKLIILDLDDTLWGGTVGEAGWENIVLGGHNAAGEALVDFQKHLKALKNRGILLAVVSKNEETVALEAIRNHPEMVLKEADLVGWKINWQDKAQNIVDLVAELNLGLDAVVFIDNNPAERARVQEAIPDVLVPDWPEEKILYPQALLNLDCFDHAGLSDEDRVRTRMYKAEQQRTRLRHQIGSLEDWLETLDIRLTVESMNDANMDRIIQLLNKTNQMNLTTRRLTRTELTGWASEEHQKLCTLRISDRFGDAGLTGILSIKREGQSLQIIDFILSCRMMGRQIEEAMLALAVRHGRAQGLQKLRAIYLPTKKNKPVFDFFKKTGLTHDKDDVFTWDLNNDYPMPNHIDVQNTSF